MNRKELSEDCISRQALIKRIDNAEENFKVDNMDSISIGEENPFVDGVLSGVFNIRQMVAQAPSVALTRKVEEWIPISERLPEPNKLVVCYITTGVTETYFLALWNDVQKTWEEGIGGCRLLERDLGYKVIAWRPLPEPYKAESEVK